MSKHRRHFTPEEKVAILRRHLVEKQDVSAICKDLNLQPTVFYHWQKEFFEHGALAFKRQDDQRSQHYEKKIQALEDKLKRKNDVLAELMEEHVALKKLLGNLEDGLGSPRYPGRHHPL
jgi:transposase-like protein